jgi:hypothetical protein
MDPKLVPAKPTAIVKVDKVTRVAQAVTNKEIAEWIKEVEQDASKREPATRQPSAHAK